MTLAHCFTAMAKINHVVEINHVKVNGGERIQIINDSFFTNNTLPLLCYKVTLKVAESSNFEKPYGFLTFSLI